MSDSEESRQFFLDQQVNQEPLFIELPAEPQPFHQEKVPSGYDPMERVYLQGRAYRNLAAGKIRWRVLILGWILFGLPALLLLIATIASASFEALGLLMFLVPPLVILGRGTSTKLALERIRARRGKRK